MAPTRTTAYRYPGELIILTFTVISVFLVIALTASATFCLSFIFIAIVLGITYTTNYSHHESLIRNAYPVNDKTDPHLTALAQSVMARIRPGPIELFIAPVKALNAYTFGLSSPKVVVLYSALFDEMDADEIRFILGHELGHVSLGHTWLNSLLGGMAGIPASIGPSILLVGAFLWWNRACEYSADRAGLLACGSINKATSALIKLHAGPGGVHNPSDLARALNAVEKEDDSLINLLAESLASHPMIVRRIKALHAYAGSNDYRRMQAWIAQ